MATNRRADQRGRTGGLVRQQQWRVKNTRMPARRPLSSTSSTRPVTSAPAAIWLTTPTRMS